MAALPVQLAAAPAATVQQADAGKEREPREQRKEGEQPEQPQQVTQRQQTGDWERYIPAQYRHFMKSVGDDARAPRNHTEASRSKANAFLGTPEESIASDPLSLQALACLSVASLVMVMVAAVRATRRTVNLHTEVLG